MKKQVLALCLAMVMLFSLVLTGCNTTKVPETTAPNTTKDTTPVTEDTTPEAEPYEVVMWIPGTEGKDHQMVMEEVNKIISAKLPNTTLNLKLVPASEYRDKFNKAMAAEEKVDIAWLANWQAYLVADGYDQGVLLPLDDLLAEYGQDILAACGEDWLKLHHMKDGKNYFMPSWQGALVKRYALFVKETIGSQMPEGWFEKAEEFFTANDAYDADTLKARLDKIEEVLEVAAAKDLLENGVNRDGMQFQRVLGTVFCNYREVVTHDNGVFTVHKYYDNDVAEVYRETMHEWWEKGYVREDVLTVGNVKDATTALYLQENNNPDWLTNQNASAPAPVMGSLMDEAEFGLGLSTGTTITIYSEMPERAMQVMNLIYSDADLYQLIVYGIEGTHYMTNSDGTITRAPAESRTYQGPDAWRLGTCINSLPESVSSIGVYEKIKELEKTAENNPLLLFSFDATPVSAETTALTAATAHQFCFYQDNFEEAEEDFIELLYDSGYQAHFDEFVRQLTAFVTENNLGTVVVAD